MRIETSPLQLSYRTEIPVSNTTSEYYYSNTFYNSRELPLSCHALSEVLQKIATSEDVGISSTSNSNGKRPLSSSSNMLSAKRRKTVSTIPQASTQTYADNEIPVYRHQFRLQFVKSLPGTTDVDTAEPVTEVIKRLIQAEEGLVDLLRTFTEGATSSESFDLGPIKIEPTHAGLVVDSVLLNTLDSRHILFVPPIRDGTAPFSESGDANDHLFCWIRLLEARSPFNHRSPFKLHGQLTMVVAPPHSWDETLEEMPFELHLDVTLCFFVPGVFQPFDGNTKKDLALENFRQNVIRFVFPSPGIDQSLAPSLHNKIDIPLFYSAIQPAPPVEPDVLAATQPKDLLPSLLPFQKRSTAWMLAREGKSIDAPGVVSNMTDSLELPLFWERVTVTRPDGEQLVWYYRRLTGTLTPEPPEQEKPAAGGILAEEPGLGKTLECISLIMLNPGIGRNPSNSIWDAVAKIDVKEVKTTLVITPLSLSQQWADELAAHAPALKVLVYEGWQKLPSILIGKAKAKAKTGSGKKGKGKVMEIDSDVEMEDINEDAPGGTGEPSQPNDWWSYVNTFDVCITTYNVLKQDLHVARAPPSRPRRETAEYSRRKPPRSPLISCEWWRVIMDEVQMVGGGQTEEMVSLIPRVSSFAVSGTPARAHISDLSHVLKFLRVDPMIYSPYIWNRLQQPEFAPEFVALFQKYTVRTMKAAVKDELTIPPQTRYLVPIALGRVEQHVYDQSVERALLELGLDARGVAASENWQVDTALLRSWLRKLRQICTHPQVGQLLKSGDKTHRSGALKTIGEVLDGMSDQNWRNLMDDRRTKVNELARRAQLIQHDQTLQVRHTKSLEVLLQAEKEASELIDEIKTAMAEHAEKGEVLKRDAAALREARGQNRLGSSGDSENSKGKGRDDSPLSDAGDSEDGDLPKTPAGEEHTIKKRALQQRLRECYVSLHRVKFLQGDVYHVLGESKAAEEDAAYAAAEDLRKKLLKITEESASRAMAQLERDANGKGFTLKDILIKTPYCSKGGIKSADLFEEADEIIEQRLNEQSRLLWKWRTHIHSLLTQKLSSGDSEADGQEYARTLATQGEAEMYLQAYAALMADRREVLISERTTLAAHHDKVKKKRNTKAAIKAIAAEDSDIEIPDDVDLQPEHEVLHKDLTEARRKLLETFDGRAVKSVMVALTKVAADCLNEKDPEKAIAKEGALSLRHLINDQGNVNDKLEADLTQFRKAFNERILYFRQLQEISDSVVEVAWDNDVTFAINESRELQNELEGKINTGRARQRYLSHLAKAQDDGDDPEEEACILCRCDFVRGYITQCAHVFCEDCMKSWLTRQGGKACPVCRVPINVDNLQRFSIEDTKKDKDQPMPGLPSRLTKDEPLPKSRRKLDYNVISSGLFDDIRATESHGSYGSKIQTLVCHLLYLQMADPGAKSIVFSAWADSLHIIEHALTMNGIPCLRIDQVKGKQNAAKRFRTDPELLVLLLHGERENAGLNVTCASRVFLLESVVHHTFEIQAIARIDRMGQRRPTEVYCYYAEDTVERNILDLAARQGYSLYTRENAKGTLNVTPLAPDSEKNVVDSPTKKKLQKGDFIFKTDDMLAILFPHMYEDIEYLLPAPGELREGSATPKGVSLGVSGNTDGSDARHTNAVAGPSRLA